MIKNDKLTELKYYENFFESRVGFEWKNSVDLCVKIIENYGNDCEAYIRVIYFLHNIALKTDHSGVEVNLLKELLTLLAQSV